MSECPISSLLKHEKPRSLRLKRLYSIRSSLREFPTSRKELSRVLRNSAPLWSILRDHLLTVKSFKYPANDAPCLLKYHPSETERLIIDLSRLIYNCMLLLRSFAEVIENLR